MYTLSRNVYAGPLKLMKKCTFLLKAVVRKKNLSKLKFSAKRNLTLTLCKGGNFIVEF